MSKRSKHIDQLYKEQLGDYSEMPPASVWESLALRLDEEDDKGGGFGDSGNDNGRPRFPIRWWWALLGLLLLIGTTVGIGKFVSFKTEQTTAVTTSPDANTRNKATAEVSTPAEQEAERAAAPKGLPTNDNTTPPNDDNTNEQTNTTTKTKSKPTTKTTKGIEEETDASAESTLPSQKVQHKVAAPTTMQKQADAKLAIAPTPKAATIQAVTQQQAPLQEVEDKSTAKQTSNVIAQEQVVEEEQAEVKEIIKEASPQLTQEKEQEQQPKQEPQQEEEKTDTQKEETTKEEKQQVVEKEEEPQVVAIAKEQAQEVAAPAKEETKTEETTKKEEEVVVDQSENKQEETNTEENTASEEVTAAAKEQPQETKQEEEMPQTKPLEVAEEEEVEEEEKTNELAYLSKNKKQLKKERKKKQKEEQETAAKEDNLGINEFNTLTPPPLKPRRWEIGIKAGYEYGFNTQAKADKFVLSPYLQYMVVPHFSLVFQPSYLWGNAKFTSTKPDEVYYNIVSTSFDSTLMLRQGDTIGVKPDTLIATYIYGKVYDSTRVSYQLKQRQLWNIELPLILQYDISPRFSVYGGVSFNFSKVLSVQQNRLDYTGLTIMDTVIAKQTYAASLPPPLPAPPQDPASYFANYGNPISQYKPYTNNTQNSFTRVGFMLGFRYTFAERYMVDVLLQQSAVNKTVITDPELQKIYSQPYMRFTLGYKIFK